VSIGQQTAAGHVSGSDRFQRANTHGHFSKFCLILTPVLFVVDSGAGSEVKPSMLLPIETNTNDTILGEACYRGNLTEMKENRASDPSCNPALWYTFIQ